MSAINETIEVYYNQFFITASQAEAVRKAVEDILRARGSGGSVNVSTNNNLQNLWAFSHEGHIQFMDPTLAFNTEITISATAQSDVDDPIRAIQALFAERDARLVNAYRDAIRGVRNSLDNTPNYDINDAVEWLNRLLAAFPNTN